MKKLKPYIHTSLIVLGIFLILFLIKGIYPFGNNSLIWGDMHDQITAFYYHFYDCFHGNKSLLVDFTTSGGVNFFETFENVVFNGQFRCNNASYGGAIATTNGIIENTSFIIKRSI